MPGLGTTGEAIKKQHFVLGYGFSQESSNKYFTNFHPNAQVNDIVHPLRKGKTLNIIGLYQINQKSSLAVTMPIVFNSFSFNPNFPKSPVSGIHNEEEEEEEEGGKPPAPRARQRAYGLGDMSIVYRSMVRTPRLGQTWNGSWGAGMVVPTGNFHATAVYPDYEGNNPASKPVFHSIMPGQGGVGIYAEAQLFKSVNYPVKGTTLWAFGNYLSQPRGRTDVSSEPVTLFAPDTPGVQHASKNSVADQYLVRWGSFIPIPYSQDRRYLRGARIFLGGRFSGAPQRDFIASSNGYRQPGQLVAAEPGLTYSLGRYAFTMTTPIYFIQRSQNDLAQQNIGEAAFLRNLATIPRWTLNLQLAKRY